MKLPFGIAQIGKSFRNEITPGNFIFRSREFEQMEIEFFCRPAEADEWYKLLDRDARATGTSTSASGPTTCCLREHEADELSHYSPATSDIEYLFPFGWGELEGIANRSDFDLTQHAEHSGKKLEYFDQGSRRALHPARDRAGRRRRPRDARLPRRRLRRGGDRGRERTVLRLHPRLAPVKAAVLPLVNKDGMPELAREIYAALAPAHAGRVRRPAARSASATAARTRSARRAASPSTARRSRTAPSPCATATPSTQDRVAIDELPDLLAARLQPPWTWPKLATA